MTGLVKGHVIVSLMQRSWFARSTTINSILKRAFYAVGLQITLTSTRRQTMQALMNHVLKLGFRPHTVIDVGVEKGTPELYGHFPNATLLLVEPLKEVETHLKRISRKHNGTYVLAAAGANPGATTLNVRPSSLGGSSVYGDTEADHMDSHSRSVPVVTLDQVCAQLKLSGLYLVKVDVQGSELDVLEGARGILADTELVVLEVSLFEFFIGGPQFYDVVHYMKERGFVVYDIVGGGNRPFDGALGQVDLAFVKENGMFRPNHIW